MKSRITIEVDFDNGNKPAIFARIESSDDVRDKLMHNFVEMLGGQSAWCKTMFVDSNLLRITPIGISELAEQSTLMRLMSDDMNNKYVPTEQEAEASWNKLWERKGNQNTFWCIECAIDGRFGVYITANLEKTKDINDAVRFADRKSAEAFMECHLSEGMVIEHSWM